MTEQIDDKRRNKYIGLRHDHYLDLSNACNCNSVTPVQFLWCTKMCVGYSSILHLKGTFITEGSSAGSCFLVFLEFQHGRTHFETFLPSGTNHRASSLVVAFQPQCNAILLATDGNHRPAYFIPILVQCFSNNSQDRVQPPLIAPASFGILLGNGQYKLAPVL
jgi:hypothetical protein